MTRGRREDLQMLLHVQAKAEGGQLYPLKVLVDNGAQASLFRRGALPESLFTPAERPLALSTVCGQPMEGGQREVSMHIGMRQEK